MQLKLKQFRQLSLFAAISASLVFSSAIVFLVGLLGAKPYLNDYVRRVVRGHQKTIEILFTESISQQVLVGDGAEILRKCHTLLREDYVRAIYIKDLGGEVVCNLAKPKDGYSIRWSHSPIFFDEGNTNEATKVWLAFSIKTEDQLIWCPVRA